MKSKAKALVRGDRVQIKNRLYAVLEKRGKIVIDVYGGQVLIYSTRKEALKMLEEGERVIRLDDIAGTVV